MDRELHGYKPVYKNAVELVLLMGKDPEGAMLLSAVHELLFSAYGVPSCSESHDICQGNKEAMHRFSDLVRTAIKSSTLSPSPAPGEGGPSPDGGLGAERLTAA